MLKYALPKRQTITENISFTDNCFKTYMCMMMIVKEERNMYAGQLKKKNKKYSSYVF